MKTCFFIVAVYSCLEFCVSLQCYSKYTDGSSTVNCSAVLHQNENCTDEVLSQLYGGLYNQQYWPAKPHDLVLVPISEQFGNFLLPGFRIINTPPRTSSIRIVKGFQIDFLSGGDINSTKCIIIQIINKTLDYQDRDNDLTFHVELNRLDGPKDYQFISWSLPKPPENEQDISQIRYGQTGVYGWALSNAPQSWVTTISYYNNIKEKYIRIWYISAPTEYDFLKYTVQLVQIWTRENSSREERNITEMKNISKTDYTFLNVKPGRYRVLVKPYDDKFDSLDCKCKTKNGGCGTCIATKTAVIVVPVPEKQPLMKAIVTRGSIPDYTIPSILGVVSFILIVIIVIAYHKMRKINYTVTTDTKQQTTTLATVEETHAYAELDKTMLVLSAETDIMRNKVTETLSSLLESVFFLNVIKSSNPPQEVNGWLGNTIDCAHLVVVVMSPAAIDQYNRWVDSGYGETGSHFINCLKRVLDKAVELPEFGDRIIIISFPFTTDFQVPNDLSSKPSFELPRQLQDFLAHISSDQFNIKEKPSMIYDNGCIGETNAGKDFLREVEYIRPKGRIPSDDSGYVDLNFLPPSPSLSRSSQVNSQHMHEQIERINFPNGV